VAVTVLRDADGTATAAPLLADLPDGRRVAASAADDTTTAELGGRDVPSVVGTVVSVEGSPPRYRLRGD